MKFTLVQGFSRSLWDACGSAHQLFREIEEYGVELDAFCYRSLGVYLYVDCVPKGEYRDLLNFYEQQGHKITHLVLIKVTKAKFVPCLEKLEKANLKPIFCFGNKTHCFLRFIFGTDVMDAIAVLEGKASYKEV